MASEQVLPSIPWKNTYQLLKSSEPPPLQLESQHSYQHSKVLSVALVPEEDPGLSSWARDSSLGYDRGFSRNGVCCDHGPDHGPDRVRDPDHVLGDDLGHGVSLGCNIPQFHAASTLHIPRYNHTPESRSLMSDLIAGAKKGDYNQKQYM